MRDRAHPPDQAQREAALDMGRSFIVQAPAGSGKTELLTQRFLRALAVVDVPSQVVAITFTRKAAAEMRARIVERLTQPPLPDTARLVLEKHPSLLMQPESLRVVTFDTLFRSLAATQPLALGLASDVSIDESPQRRYEQAAQAALADPDIKEEVQRVLAQADGDYARVVDQIATLLGKRDQWLPLNQLDTQQAHTFAAVQHTRVCNEVERTLRRLAAEIVSRVPTAQRQTWLALGRFSGERLATPVALGSAWPAAQLSAIPAWKHLLSLVLTKEGDPRRSIDKRSGFPSEAKREKEALAELWRDLSDQMRWLALCQDTLKQLPDEAQATQADAPTVDALLRVLTRAAAYLDVDFAHSNTADFVAIALAVHRGLHGPERSLERTVAQSIRHLLVDEYQDTSRTQFAFLEGVARAWQQAQETSATFFCVGDPMQSIYRFRQAEVALFAQTQREGIAGHPLVPLTLSANFRSDPLIVEWVNHNLQAAVEGTSALVQAQISFAPGVAVRPADPGARVVLHAFSDHEREASFVAEAVERALAAGSESIGVLMASRAAGAAVIEALRARAIAADTREAERPRQAAWVRDLSTLAYALSEPDDRLSWLALLRAPWCGLTLPDLTRIAEAADATGRTVWGVLWDAAQHKFRSLHVSDEASKRLARFVAQMEPCMQARGVRALADLTEAAWARLEARLVCPAPTREAFERLIETVRACESGGKLLDRDAFEAMLDRDPLPEEEWTQTARVQVMTIHKAKGLQFDTVFVVGLARGERNDTKPLLRWARFADGAVIAPAPRATQAEGVSVFAWLEAIEHAERAAERARLLYVATTRAKRVLVLTATTTADAEGLAKRPAQSLLAALPQATPLPFHHDEEGVPTIEGAHSRPTGAVPASAPLLRRRKTPAAPPRRIVPEWVHVPAREDDDARSARALGRVIHEWLAAHGNTGAWTDAAQAWAREVLREHGAPVLRIDGLVAQCQAMVERVHRCPQAAFIFDPRHRAWNECELLSAGEGHGPVRLRPDRVFQTAEGVWWIVDYKSSSPLPGEPRADFLVRECASYAGQLRGYERAVRAWQQIPQDIRVHQALYFPALGALEEIPDAMP